MVSYDLHGATEEMYLQARALMERLGLAWQLSGSGGGVVLLPQTTFVMETSFAASDIMTRVWNELAASRLNPKRVAVVSGGYHAARSIA